MVDKKVKIESKGYEIQAAFYKTTVGLVQHGFGKSGGSMFRRNICV
jgi:hypothetical protein